MPEECIFCKIIEGQVESEEVYEDKNNFAILDINPSSPGHTLVFPKKHAIYLKDLKDTEISDLFFVVDEVIAILEDSLSPDGFNIGWNHGQAAGQAVPHIHVHIIPRYEGDQGAPIQAIVKPEKEIDVSAIANKINSGGVSVQNKQTLETSAPQPTKQDVNNTEEEDEEKEKNKNDDEDIDDEDDGDVEEARKRWNRMKIPRY